MGNQMTPGENRPAASAEKASQPAGGLWGRVRGALHGPLLVGIVAAIIAIALSLYGMIVNHAAPLTLTSVGLVVLIAGGSWGLIAWAIATAAVEAGKE